MVENQNASSVYNSCQWKSSSRLDEEATSNKQASKAKIVEGREAKLFSRRKIDYEGGERDQTVAEAAFRQRVKRQETIGADRRSQRNFKLSK